MYEACTESLWPCDQGCFIHPYENTGREVTSLHYNQQCGLDGNEEKVHDPNPGTSLCLLLMLTLLLLEWFPLNVVLQNRNRATCLNILQVNWHFKMFPSLSYVDSECSYVDSPSYTIESHSKKSSMVKLWTSCNIEHLFFHSFPLNVIVSCHRKDKCKYVLSIQRSLQFNHLCMGPVFAWVSSAQTVVPYPTAMCSDVLWKSLQLTLLPYLCFNLTWWTSTVDPSTTCIK